MFMLLFGGLDGREAVNYSFSSSRGYILTLWSNVVFFKICDNHKQSDSTIFFWKCLMKFQDNNMDNGSPPVKIVKMIKFETWVGTNWSVSSHLVQDSKSGNCAQLLCKLIKLLSLLPFIHLLSLVWDLLAVKTNGTMDFYSVTKAIIISLWLLPHESHQLYQKLINQPYHHSFYQPFFMTFRALWLAIINDSPTWTCRQNYLFSYYCIWN